jgi:lipoprotein signal peptidase
MSGPKAEDARQDTTVAAAPPLGAERGDQRRLRLTAMTVLAAVIVLDQAAKWWAWRHVAGAEINPGGDQLVGSTVGDWYGAPVTGALLDLLDAGLLGLAVTVLLRRRRPAAVVVLGAVMLGGWGSNLLDRLGLHYLTAPGSVRGAVDFIPVAGTTCNLADLCIVGAAPLMLLAAGYLRWRSAHQPAAEGAAVPATRCRLRARALMPAVAGAGGVIAVVTLGAATYGGISAAPPHVSAISDAHTSSVSVSNPFGYAK